jgi:hypothetical protein
MQALTPFRNHARDRKGRLSVVISLMRRMLARSSGGNAMADYPQEPSA